MPLDANSTLNSVRSECSSCRTDRIREFIQMYHKYASPTRVASLGRSDKSHATYTKRDCIPATSDSGHNKTAVLINTDSPHSPDADL